MIKDMINKWSSCDEILLVIDYDRTLVNNKKEIMLKTKKNLIEFQRKGGKIAIASGRPKSGLDKVAKELKLNEYNGYIIGANGAEVYCYEKDEILSTNNISVDDLSIALKSIEKIDVCKGIYSAESLFVSGYTGDLADEANSNCLSLKIRDLNANLIESSKIILSKTRETTHSYYDEVCALLPLDLNVVKSSPRYIEITSKKADKGLGIERIKEEKESLKLIIGIGDSQNDSSMLLHSDIKVAMGNGTQNIKDLADIVIGTNEEDGIGVFLDEYII